MSSYLARPVKRLERDVLVLGHLAPLGRQGKRQGKAEGGCGGLVGSVSRLGNEKDAAAGRAWRGRQKRGESERIEGDFPNS